jgi:hypothetical protein
MLAKAAAMAAKTTRLRAPLFGGRARGQARSQESPDHYAGFCITRSVSTRFDQFTGAKRSLA